MPLRHPNRVTWADFVRGLVSEQATEAMREHLATGCRRCRRAVAFLRRLLELAETDTRDAPPELAKRSVKALFALHQPERRARFSRLRLATGSVPAPAGVRGPQVSGQAARYESDEYSLDLQLDAAVDANDLLLSGQLLKQTGEPVAGTAAYLVVGGRVTATCFTSGLGKLQMELEGRETAQLCLLVDDGEPISVALDPGAAGPS